MLICQYLVRTSISDIAAVVDSSETEPRSVGLYISTSLTDYLWHLLSLSRQKTYLDQEEEGTVHCFRTAYRILEKLSPTTVSAQQALKTMKGPILTNIITSPNLEQALDFTLRGPIEENAITVMSSGRATSEEQFASPAPVQVTASNPYRHALPPEAAAEIRGSISDRALQPRRHTQDDRLGDIANGTPSGPRTDNFSPPDRPHVVDELQETYGNLDFG